MFVHNMVFTLNVKWAGKSSALDCGETLNWFYQFLTAINICIMQTFTQCKCLHKVVTEFLIVWVPPEQSGPVH